MSKISSECLVGDHRLTNRKGDEDDDCDDDGDGSMMKIMMWIMLYECLVGEVTNMPHHQPTVWFQTLRLGEKEYLNIRPQKIKKHS